MKLLWLLPETMNMEPVVATKPGSIYTYTKHPESALPPEVSHRGMLETVEEEKPDLIMYVGVSGGPYFTKAKIFRQMKAPVVHFCCDAACPGWQEGIRYYLQTKPFIFTVNIDGNDEWEKGGKDFTSWCPLDPSYYKEKPKTIRFGWAGGLGSPERQHRIQDLEDIIKVMPRNEKWGSYQEYADFLSCCQINLNMAKSGSGQALQTKNRVRETGYAKCLLLEERGSPTSNWFELGKDYLDYGSSEEIRAIVNSLEDSYIEEMATRFQEKVLRLYSPEIFWEKVLSRL